MPKARSASARKPDEIRCVLMSGSMEPLLPVGEEVLIRKVSADELKRYDMIVFKQHGKLICHFVWDRNRFQDPGEEPTWLTRSIQSLNMDLPVKESEILGKVVSHRIGWGLRVKVNLRLLFGK